MMDTTTVQQLVRLLSDRGEIDDQITTFQQEKQAIDDQISRLLPADGRTVKVPGYGSACLSKPFVATSFDPDALRDLMQSLRETGQGDIADEIHACTKQSPRAGGVRITRTRKRTS